MKKIIELTEKQKNDIRAAVLNGIYEAFADHAYHELYYGFEGGEYIKGDYGHIEYEPSFIQAWNEAFKRHKDKLVPNNKIIDRINELIYTEVHGIRDESEHRFFTANSCKQAIKCMEKDVLASPLMQKALEGIKNKSEEDANLLKKRIEEMGYVVVISKK